MLPQRYLNLYLMLILSFISFSTVLSEDIPIDLGQPFNISGENIILNISQSALSEEKRAQYFSWVGIRDSFYYSGRTDLLIQLITYFSPETDGYLSKLFIFGIVYFALAGLMALLLILYLIFRFVFKLFGGPKKYENSFGVRTWIMIATGMTISFVALSIAMYHSNKFNTNVQTMLKYTDAQIGQMQSIHDQLLANETELKQNAYKDIPIQTSISNIEKITKNHEEQKKKLNDFADLYNTRQSPKFNYEISYLFFMYLLGILSIGSYFYRKTLVTWIISFAIFVLSVPATIILGLNCAYLILSTDFCQTIGKSIINQQAPTDSTGLGYYISCPSAQTIKYLRISMYEFSTSYDALYTHLNEKLKPMGDGLPIKKRDNEALKAMKEKYQADNAIASGLNSLIVTNNILAPLLSQLSCQTAYNSISYIEENFCSESMDYLFYSIMINMAGIVGSVILGIGVNKLIIVINNKNVFSLRGNKKYHDELYEENKDDGDKEMDKENSLSKSRIIN